MPNSSVVADLIANDKVTVAVNKAATGLKRYADQTRASLSQVSTQFNRLGSSVGAFTRGIPGLNAFTGSLGAAGLVGAMGKAVAMAKVQEDAERKLAAVLKATGGAAGLSAEEIKKFAATRQQLTNFGDEATIAVSAVLATFTKVRGDVFKDAMVAIQDMTAVLGGDMQGKALQLGKALNDPVKGMEALRDAGVSFTQQQRDQIKALQESGDILGAQKIILAELKGEFGGLAEAMADPITQMKNALSDWAEGIGSDLLPIIRTLAKDLKSGAEDATGSWSKTTDEFGVLGETILNVADAVGYMRSQFANSRASVTALIRDIAHELRKINPKVPGTGMHLVADPEFMKAFEEELNRTLGQQMGDINRRKNEPSFRERVAAERNRAAQASRAAAGKAVGIDPGETEEAKKAAKALKDQIDKLKESLQTPVESAQAKWKEYSEWFRAGKLDAETFRRAVADLKKDLASGFGPLLSEDLQAKINAKFADIEKDFQQRFGRGLSDQQALAERQARRQQSTRDVLGLEKTPQEQHDEAMRRAAAVRGQGLGDQADRIERDARRKQIEAIRDEARERAGLNAPYADLQTNSERLRNELAAIKETYRQGGYGATGSGGAVEIMRRSVAGALDQYGKQAPEAVQPRFEGLQDTWRRIQESAAGGRSDDPQERAARAAEANKDVLTNIFGETKEFNKWLQKWFEKKENKAAVAG